MLLFEVGSPVTSDDFINRKEELKNLIYYIQNQQNVMIKAPRRFGKTSLIKQCLLKQKPHAIYIDVKRVPTLSYMTEQILNEAYAIVGVNNFFEQFRSSVAKFISTVKAKISIPLFNILILTLEKVETEKDFEELFLYSLDTVENIATESNKDIVIVLDEFQDIIDLGSKRILDKMRSVIQHHKKVTYIFAGSHETLMTTIFQDKKSPFFHFCRFMSLGGLHVGDLSDYICKKFAANDIKIDQHELDLIFMELEGHPYYSMKVMQILHYNCSIKGIKYVDKSLLSYALSQAIFETESYIQDIITRLKSKKYCYEVVYNLANQIKNDLPSTTLFKTYSILVEMGILLHLERGIYKITDSFLKMYIREDANLK